MEFWTIANIAFDKDFCLGFVWFTEGKRKGQATGKQERNRNWWSDMEWRRCSLTGWLCNTRSIIVYMYIYLEKESDVCYIYRIWEICVRWSLFKLIIYPNWYCLMCASSERNSVIQNTTKIAQKIRSFFSCACANYDFHAISLIFK